MWVYFLKMKEVLLKEDLFFVNAGALNSFCTFRSVGKGLGKHSREVSLGRKAES